MVGVGDEVAPRPAYALEAAQGADREAAEDLYQELVCEAGQREPLLGWLFHLVELAPCLWIWRSTAGNCDG